MIEVGKTYQHKITKIYHKILFIGNKKVITENWYENEEPEEDAFMLSSFDGGVHWKEVKPKKKWYSITYRIYLSPTNFDPNRPYRTGWFTEKDHPELQTRRAQGQKYEILQEHEIEVEVE